MPGRETNRLRMTTMTLHRYYIWADRMRFHFDAKLEKSSPPDIYDIETRLYMSYWYAALYVVVEGWKTLKLADSEIDELLTSSNVALLKEYRNGVFHFQRKYDHAKFQNFLKQGAASASWVRALNNEFGRFFLNWHEGQKRVAAQN